MADDSDEEDEPNDPLHTISIQQAIQHFTESNEYFDADAGTSEAEITFMQDLMSKTMSLRDSWQVQSAIPFPRTPRMLQNYY